jgi:hypothetical protein
LNLSVRREPGSNVIAIKRAMTPVVEDLNRSLLERNGLELRLVNDDVKYVEDSVRNVFQNLLLGALLATIVMYLFLRSRQATFVGVLGMPISTLAAFLGLLIAGRTINVISLAGIAFAIGMTLDNTIVVLENIERLRRSGMERLQATVTGVREVWPAVLASTLTTVLVFAPILFVEQEAGQLFSDIAIAISAAILASMAVAILLVPAAIARFGFSGKAADRRDGRIHAGILAAIDRLVAAPAARAASACRAIPSAASSSRRCTSASTLSVASAARPPLAVEGSTQEARRALASCSRNLPPASAAPATAPSRSLTFFRASSTSFCTAAVRRVPSSIEACTARADSRCQSTRCVSNSVSALCSR